MVFRLACAGLEVWVFACSHFKILVGGKDGEGECLRRCAAES